MTRDFIIRADGVLHYKLYSQDGKLIPMTCRDTPDMRRFTEWVRKFDRNTNEADYLASRAISTEESER